MRRAAGAALLCAPLLAGAVSMEVRVRDADTGLPLPGTFVVAREFATVAKIHGHETFCVRAAAAAMAAARQRLDLPFAGSDVIHRATGLEAFAYRPGYCVARAGRGAAASYSKAGPGPSAGFPRPPVFDPAGGADLALRRSDQAPDERLRYLLELGTGLVCQRARWQSGSPAALAAMASAMLAEADGLARDGYERALAARLRLLLQYAERSRQGPSDMPPQIAATVAPSQPFARDFILAPAGTRILWPSTRASSGAGNPGVMAIPAVVVGEGRAVAAAAAAPAAAGNAPLASAPARPPVAAAPSSAGSGALVIHCRHGSPSACNLSQRNVTGETTLYYAVKEAHFDKVKLLLESGADPNAGSETRTPLEAALRELLDADPTSLRAATTVRIVELLAGHPDTRLPGRLREDIAADPATWGVRSSPGAGLVAAQRERLLRLPAQSRRGCEPFDASLASDAPLRLRF